MRLQRESRRCSTTTTRRRAGECVAKPFQGVQSGVGDFGLERPRRASTPAGLNSVVKEDALAGRSRHRSRGFREGRLLTHVAAGSNDEEGWLEFVDTLPRNPTQHTVCWSYTHRRKKKKKKIPPHPASFYMIFRSFRRTHPSTIYLLFLSYLSEGVRPVQAINVETSINTMM